MILCYMIQLPEDKFNEKGIIMNSTVDFTRKTPRDFSKNVKYTEDAVAASSFLRSVFNWMALGLLITGLCAWGFAGIITRYAESMPNLSFLGLIAMIADLILVITFMARLQKMSIQSARSLFIVHSILEGIGISYIFLIYTSASIATTFFVCAATFAAMSLYGMSTKTNLTKLRNYLLMGFIGIIIMSVVNIFVGASSLYWLISIAGVVLFCAITAYDVQHLLRLGDRLGENSDARTRLSLYGALKLHIDFIGLFIYLLRFLGKAKN